MQLDQALQGKRCARCRHATHSDPAFDARFGAVPADSRAPRKRNEAQKRQRG